MKQLVLLILCSLVLLSTSCTTGYQKRGVLTLTGGFKELDLGHDIYRVNFAGNGYTTQETAQTLWLYRCAELTLEKGYDAFEILSDIRLSKPSAPMNQLDRDTPSLQPAQYVVVVPNNVERPTMEADIRLLKPPYFARPPKVFDARKLQALLEPHVAGAIKSRRNVKPHAHEYIYPERTTRPRPL